MAGSAPKNQHYIWQHYLRAWAQKGRVWCVRSPEKRAFLTNTSNIGSQTYFYQTHELDEHDIAYLKMIISKASSAELRELNNEWLTLSQTPFALRTVVEKRVADPAESLKLLEQLKILEKTGIEQYHTSVEAKATPFLALLRAGDASFFEDPSKAFDFLHFLAFQYFRTARMRNLAGPVSIKGPWSPHRTWLIESFIYATNLGAHLFAERNRYAISFLRNESSVQFIAGDQPVINRNSHTDSDVCLFYPVSPKMAILYSADRERFPLGISSIRQVGAETYNYLLYCKSDSQIYGNNQAYLEEMATMPKDAGLS